MKIKNLTIPFLFVFILCAAFIIPTPNLLSDYRDAYVGTYLCQNKAYYLRPGEATSHVTETVTVTVSKAALDSVMQINIGTGSSFFKLKSEVLYSYPDENNLHRGGKFYAADSIGIYFTSRGSGSTIWGKKN